jgi:hydroxyacylglutathione hydrolase
LPSVDLGNSSFVVGDLRRGVAAVIDPTRDVGRYLDLISAEGLSLRWVLDTHLHADFVSGGAELAGLGRATLGLGAEATTAVPHRPLDDGDELDLGSASLTVMKSPGHSPEHVSYLLSDEGPRVLFSGGSLMAGSAGRPDLLGASWTYRLVHEEFDTLHHRYADLPSSVTVLPTHAGGSFCGVAARATPRTTLGRERRSNPLLRASDRRAFAARYLTDAPFPDYYATDRRINESGAPPLGRELPNLPAIAPEAVEEWRRHPGTTVLDVRAARAFANGHVPGSLSVPVDGAFSAYVGWLRPVEEEFVIVDEDAVARRAAQVALLRIGYDGLRGHLAGGVDAYRASGHALASTEQVTVRSLRRAIERGDAISVVDARNPGETMVGALPGAVNIPLPELRQRATDLLDRSVPVYVHCQSGRRAGIAASILEQLGFPEVMHVTDGPTTAAASHAPSRRPLRRR